MTRSRSSRSDNRPSAARPSMPQENAKPPAGKALSPSCSSASASARSNMVALHDLAGIEQRQNACAIGIQRRVEQDDQMITLETHAPMQIAGVPAELERARVVAGLEAPDLLLAETGDDGAIGVEMQQRAV